MSGASLSCRHSLAELGSGHACSITSAATSGSNSGRRYVSDLRSFDQTEPSSWRGWSRSSLTAGAVEALLIRQGLRATGGEGSHMTVEDATSAQYTKRLPELAKPTFERLRRTRHAAHTSTRPVPRSSPRTRLGRCRRRKPSSRRSRGFWRSVLLICSSSRQRHGYQRASSDGVDERARRGSAPSTWRNGRCGGTGGI
jgi:hypothetical protein